MEKKLRENLRLVCPNCHSQTSTFGSKNASPEGRKKMSESAKKIATGGRHNHKYYKTIRVAPLPKNALMRRIK